MTEPADPADDIATHAILWLVRSRDPAFADWAGLEHWLAASPAHADAYHQAAAAEADMVELLAAAPPRAVAAVPERPRWRSASWLGGAVAAALVLVAGYGALRPAEPILYETAPGAHRVIALADGTRIALNGATRVAVATNDPRAVRLEQGEALFTVRHDPAHPFSVRVADATIADVGTVFDVVRDRKATRVAVAQGTVVWNPASEAVRLDAGRGLRTEDGGSTLTLSAVDRQAVGGWSRGQLIYDGVPLGLVVADVSRALGVAIEASPAVAQRPVRGVIRLEGGAQSVVPRLGALMGVRARSDGTRWRLSVSP